MNRWGLLSLFVALPVLACAGDPIPPPGDDASLDGWVTVASDPTRVLRLGDFDVVLETTTLRDVQAAVGTGRLDQAGDAGESVRWICYTWPAGGQRLWLTSGVIGGGERIDGITAIAFSGRAMETDACPELPARSTPVRVVDGPWLGSSEAEVRAAYGPPSGERWAYAYEGKQGRFDVLAHRVFRFADGKATFVRMGRVTTY